MTPKQKLELQKQKLWKQLAENLSLATGSMIAIKSIDKDLKEIDDKTR